MDFILGVLSRRACIHRDNMNLLPSYTFGICHEWWLVQWAVCPAATTCSAQWSSSTVNHLLSELFALWAQSQAQRAFTLRAFGARLLRASWALRPSRFRSTQSRAACSNRVKDQQNLIFCTGSTSAVQASDLNVSVMLKRLPSSDCKACSSMLAKVHLSDWFYAAGILCSMSFQW